MKLENLKSQFDTFLSGLKNESTSLLDFRKETFNSFINNGYPSKKDENWQYTDLTSISKSNFDLLENTGIEPNKNIIDKISIQNSNRIVIQNGIFNKTLSQFTDGISVKNVVDILSHNNINDFQNNTNSFVSLNNAFVNGGWHIDIKSKMTFAEPIHIINIITDARESVQNHQLNIINIGQNSSISIIEEYINTSQNKLFNNAVYNIDLEKNSKLDYTTFQDNKSDNINLNHIFVKQSNDSSYNAQFITKNGKLIRNDIDVQINGENCDTDISGLGLLDGIDHIENYTVVNHNKAHCNSKQLYKYILKDSSEGVFNGLVKVQSGAQQTDSHQTNRNILLSKKALMNSNPQLEIYADDVKCAHGSATGELDEDAIFYLRSRGIDLVTAKSLLIEGFAKEVVMKIKNEHFSDRINQVLLKWLSI
jgi:Fe-S cluster assembly protein SufD